MNTYKAGLTHYLYKIYVSQARNWHPVDANSVGMTAIIEFSPLNLMRFFSTMHQGKKIEKSAVHQRYSFLFIASHVVRKHFDYQETCRTFFSKSCLDYKTCHISKDQVWNREHCNPL